MAFKNGTRPVHPGELLREEYLVPLEMSVNALAKALAVPTPRINDVVRKKIERHSSLHPLSYMHDPALALGRTQIALVGGYQHCI